MSPPGRPPRVRRADPTLGAHAASSSAGPLRWTVAVLLAALAALRRLRTLRRWRGWNWIRVAAIAVAVPVAVLEPGLPRAAAIAAAAIAAVLRRTPDPDLERRIQRIHRADYLLNGGEWAGAPRGEGADRLRTGAELYILLRGAHLLIVPKAAGGQVHAAIRVDEISRIRVDGVPYVPVYVSMAKQPPSRERDFDRHAVSELLLDVRQGEGLRLRYRGPFAAHLAETAAHAVHSVRFGPTPVAPVS